MKLPLYLRFASQKSPSFYAYAILLDHNVDNDMSICQVLLHPDDIQDWLDIKTIKNTHHLSPVFLTLSDMLLHYKIKKDPSEVIQYLMEEGQIWINWTSPSNNSLQSPYRRKIEQIMSHSYLEDRPNQVIGFRVTYEDHWSEALQKPTFLKHQEWENDRKLKSLQELMESPNGKQAVEEYKIRYKINNEPDEYSLFLKTLDVEITLMKKKQSLYKV
jgi:hypothetical protein